MSKGGWTYGFAAGNPGKRGAVPTSYLEPVADGTDQKDATAGKSSRRSSRKGRYVPLSGCLELGLGTGCAQLISQLDRFPSTLARAGRHPPRPWWLPAPTPRGAGRRLTLPPAPRSRWMRRAPTPTGCTGLPTGPSLVTSLACVWQRTQKAGIAATAAATAAARRPFLSPCVTRKGAALRPSTTTPRVPTANCHSSAWRSRISEPMRAVVWVSTPLLSNPCRTLVIVDFTTALLPSSAHTFAPIGLGTW